MATQRDYYRFSSGTSTTHGHTESLIFTAPLFLMILIFMMFSLNFLKLAHG